MSDNEVTPESKPRRRAAGRPAGPPVDAPAEKADKAPAKAAAKKKAPAVKKAPIAVPVFQSAPVTAAPAKKKAVAKSASSEETLSVAKKGQTKKAPAKKAAVSESADSSESTSNETSESGEERTGGNNRNRNRNRRGGKNKNRAKSANGVEGSELEEGTAEASDEESTESAEAASARKRSRKRTRDGSDSESGSTRLDAKRNRRRDGRDAGRRRAPILTESEFLARRENVERVMVVRQQGARTQIAVLEDGIVVEHYINQSSSGSLVGNVYLGRVQNVLPGMEAAFVDIGKGRNAVLYAGEVNWDAAGLDGQPKKIETALKSGDPVLVQVTKDPVGQKGARLTSQISLPGRFLVYVPNNPMTGISRKLPDRERSRLKTILKAVVPEDAGVIVRTASEGASEEELGRDVARLAAQWTDIEAKSKTASPPTMLYGEPDISIKVVRDIFNEDVKKLIVSGADAWETVEQYVSYVAPDLADRLKSMSAQLMYLLSTELMSRSLRPLIARFTYLQVAH
jgi:ribonuclease E